jgi:cephalosporin-C deacetylase-like acetyl esterase
MMKCVLALMVLISYYPNSAAQDPYPELVRRFDYDRKAPLDLKRHGVTERGKVKIYDISYVSLKGGRVPAYLVVPQGKRPFAGILFGHWAMKGSSVRNRAEFLDEAVALAETGVVSLLPDAPFARPGYKESDEPFDPREPEFYFQQLLDLRRGVDLLLSRKDIDPARIAYVGHSYNANVGGVLAGVEKRIKTFVLMAGSLSDAEGMRSDHPDMVKLRQSIGAEKIEKMIAQTSWLDPFYYIGHAAPSSVLLQYAHNDGILTDSRVQYYFGLVSEPKMLKFYNATHALNAQARRDRFEWLRKHLELAPLDPAVLDGVGQVK